jgi:hypothetical protein
VEGQHWKVSARALSSRSRNPYSHRTQHYDINWRAGPIRGNRYFDRGIGSAESREQFHHLLCEFRPDAASFALEIDERLYPTYFLIANEARPTFDVGRLICPITSIQPQMNTDSFRSDHGSLTSRRVGDSCRSIAIRDSREDAFAFGFGHRLELLDKSGCAHDDMFSGD